jgi:Tol biopolymer transport system component
VRGAWFHAQDFPPPPVGHLIGYTSTPANAITLYDTATELSYTLDFGDAQHHLWDFSADGCRILFSLTDGNRPSTLHSAALDGSDMRDIVDTTAIPEQPDAIWDVWDADWSPDGTRVAVRLSREGENGRVSYVGWVGADGGTPTLYSVAGDEYAPTWSPDGAWLAYLSYEQRPAGATPYATAVPDTTDDDTPTLREADLWTVSADGATKVRITRFDVGSVETPRWSPDGTLLGFTYQPSSGESQLWMIAATENAIPTQLSFQWHQTLDLVWRPDGSAMVTAARNFQDVSAARLWQIPLIGNADTDAIPFFNDDGTHTPADFPRFNRDGSALVYRRGYQLVYTHLQTQEVVTLDGVGNTPAVWSPRPVADCAASP